MKMSRKCINLRAILVLIEFSQNISQALWKDDDPFIQIPHLNDKRIKALKKALKSTNIEQYARLTREQRKALALFDNDAEFEDHEQAVGCFPLIDIQIDVSVGGEVGEIAVGDILTMKLTIINVSITEKQERGFIHSNKFPFLKKD